MSKPDLRLTLQGFAKLAEALGASRTSLRQAARQMRTFAKHVPRRRAVLPPMTRTHPRHHPPLSAQAKKSIRANRRKRWTELNRRS
jgi:hypothetical protein